ncbi:hypothetical protein [Streptomyces violascens]|uniref:hypothetical protein n=1 Tax=Streptomyces violascens TaxID=67381 RepID=UPI0036CFEB7F
MAEDAQRHITWTADGGWSEPVTLKGHDSNNTPALLVCKEGPAGNEREALLMVHRGIDRWVPPQPPAPPGLADVASREATVHGPWVSDEGAAGASRLRHQVSATPATLKNGKKVLIISWEAHAEYYWGFSYFSDHSGYPRAHIGKGTLFLQQRDGRDTAGREFSAASVDSSGRYRADIIIDRPAPGTYTLSNSYGIVKAGGYWADPEPLHPKTDDLDLERWSKLQVNTKSKATITLT